MVAKPPVTRNNPSMSFVKLDCGILDSSLWSLSPQRELFITALLMALPYHLDVDAPQLDLDGKPTGFVVPAGDYGFIRAAWVGVVERAKLDVNSESEKAMRELGDPDPFSKSERFEGRRLVRVNGGMIVLNFDEYRKRDHTAAERMRRMRAKQKPRVTRNKRNVTQQSVTVTQAEAEAEAEAEVIRISPQSVDEIYSAYPRKVGKPAAIKAIKSALIKFSFDQLLRQTKAFAEARNGDIDFCPNPSTWFNQERFNDDPSTWKPNGTNKNPAKQNPRISGTSLEGTASRYRGVGKVQ